MSGDYPSTIEGTDGRIYYLDDRGRVIGVTSLEEEAAQQRAECEAEFRSSWVAGGGRKEDVGLAWAMHRDAYMKGAIG